MPRETIYIGPKHNDGADVFGCRHKTVKYSTGVYSECVCALLANYKSHE